MKLHWGHGIALAFALFGTMIIALVFASFWEKIDLVTTDYYSEEIRYQKRIDEMKNLNNERDSVKIEIKKDYISILFPHTQAKGKIRLFRPSNAKLDIEVPITQEKGLQLIPKQGLAKGLWRVQLFWKNGDKDFYYEKKIEL